MTGLSNYTADNTLSWLTGQVAQPALPAAYLALFTAVGTDAGTGFTEVSGGAYARVQVAGTATTSATTATSSAVLHFSSVPSWVVPGMTVYDVTAGTAITGGTTVSSVTGTTVTMSANAAGSGVGSGDTIVFSSFNAPSGTAPSSDTNGGVITFPQATANWGTIIAWGLYDASSSGNLLMWDFLGNYSWLPAFSTNVGSGNGAVFSTHAHGYSNGDPVVASAEYGGTLPTCTQESLASYVINYVANETTDTFTLSTSSTSPGSGNAVWTSTSGAMLVRKVTQQIIPQNVTASFAASAFNLLAA